MSARRASRRAPAATAGKAPAAGSGLANGAAQALLAGLGWLAHGLRGLATSPDVRRLVLLGALGAGVAAASDAARARVEAWPRYELDRAALTTTPLPPCLSERARRDLERLPLPPRPSAFDPQLVPFTAACLASLPWVRQVEHVSLDAHGQLAFSLVAREPVARVLYAGGDGALTRDGDVVPLDYAAQQDALPSLAGVPAAGEPRARALTAAIAVLAELEDLRAHVSAIDLSNLEGKTDPLQSEVVLTLSSGLLVDWGRPPVEGAACLDGAAKRQALRTVLEGDGLDLATVERVSVRWDEVTYLLKAPVTPPVVVAAAVGSPRR